MVYVVLGMHKSGTTLVSQMLHYSGINMVDEDVITKTYDQGYQYERESTWRLNELILDCPGTESIDIIPPRMLSMTAEERRDMRGIISQCAQDYGPDWGFKDPRTCLTYPLWAEELPEHKIIAIYRSVDELWLRYRHKRFYNRVRDPIQAWKVINRWREANVNLIDYLKSGERDFILLEYQKLMTTDDEFERLEKFVGRSLNDQRRKDLYRHKQTARSWPLELAKWMSDFRFRQHPDRIAQQLEGLR